MANSLLDKFRSLFVGEDQMIATDDLPRLKQINQRKAGQNQENSGSFVMETSHIADDETRPDNHGVAHWTFNSDKLIRQSVRKSDQLAGVAVGFEVDPH